ncbi:MAG: branched-chain amino acid ABC transporter permease [Syntrophales bacterium]
MKSDKRITQGSETEGSFAALIRKPRTWLILAGVLCFLILPRIGSQYVSYLVLTFFGYGVALLGLNLLFGYTGLLSFGHALFFAAGAYTVSYMSGKFGVFSMELSILAAIIVAAVIAALIGAICVRYIKIYFALLMLAFGMLMYSFLIKFYYLTGGDEGMPVLRPQLLGLDLSSLAKMDFLTGWYYYYTFALFALATWGMWRIISSPFGLALKAVRDNPEKAYYLGIDVRRYRWYAFIVSAVYASVGGALVAPVIGNVDPTLTYWTHSGTLVFMTLLGGFSNFLGPLLGGLVYIFLQDGIMSLLHYWRFVFGAILAFIVIAAPGGLAGAIEIVVKRIYGKRDEA